MIEYQNIFVSGYNIHRPNSNYIINDATKIDYKNELIKYNFPINYINALNYGENINIDNGFLISCYAFSEIERKHQTNYINKLFKKINHGFFAWNFINVYDFGKRIIKTITNISYEDTGVNYVYF